jgi:hypothetical protein
LFRLKYDLILENGWIKLDRLVLHDWGWRAAIESTGQILPFYLEFCYVLVYGLAAFSLAWIAVLRTTAACHRLLLGGVSGGHALPPTRLFPYFPSLPPRYAFPALGGTAAGDHFSANGQL